MYIPSMLSFEWLSGMMGKTDAVSHSFDFLRKECNNYFISYVQEL